MANLTVNIAGLELKNPVITASGTYGSGLEYGRLIDINRLGAICTKTVTLQPFGGNPPPRLWETPCGMLNSIGLQNDGIESFIAKDLAFLAKYDLPVIVSIAGTSVDDCSRLAKILSPLPEVDALELNISCPNVKAEGVIFGSSEKMASEVVAKTRLATTKPLIVKLTPNTGNIAAVAAACERAGADALSLINTVLGMAVDINTLKPRLGNVVGGLSGPAIKPIGVRMVWEVANTVGLPIIGMGGIVTAADALEYVIAGATAVAVGTANFIDPQAPLKVIEGIENYLDEHKIDKVSRLIGAIRID